MTPRVVDTSHHNTVNDLSATAAAGVWGVIHKATQGSSYIDPDYDKRRKMALNAGLLWGAYHFNDGSDVSAQVNHFLSVARGDDSTLYVLDYEDNPKSQMSPQQMVQFLRLIEQITGRKATIYSGNRLKETLHLLSANDRAYVCQHKLWLCQYGPRAVLPPGFTSYFLWQFTDGQVGPQPHQIAGISGNGIDLNTFDGTIEELRTAWAPSAGAQPDAALSEPIDVDDSSTSMSSHAADAAQDAAQDGVETIADAPELPATPQPPNVHPETARYSVDVEVVQRHLDQLGYHEVGAINGKWGGKTAAAVAAFFNDRGLQSPPVMGQTLNDALGDAMQDNWTRPIATERANATPKDLAPKVEAVRLNLWQRLGAKISVGAAGLGLTGSGLSSTFDTVRDKLQPVHDTFAKVPPEAWFLLMAAVAGVVWYATSRAAMATTKDYNTGRLN